MMTVRSGQNVAASPRWLLALLAPALVIGIVAMHSLLVAPAQERTMLDSVATAATSHEGHAPIAADSTTVAEHGDDGGRGSEGGMSDCSGLMAICLALLVSLAVLVLRGRGRSDRVLWQRPLSTFNLGTIREAFESLTALQRTDVLRC